MTVDLDLTLELKQLQATKPHDFTTKNEKHDRSPVDRKTTVRNCTYGEFTHKNYMEYLAMCWGSHYGVVLTPDIYWYTILSEIASHIKANSEKYRSLFTTSNGKVEIIVQTTDDELIDLNLILKALEKAVPTNTKVFLPEFTTSTDSSRLAFKAAFADAMTPYYNYSMYMCGLRKINLLGSEEDWRQIRTSLEALKEILDCKEYLDTVIELTNSINLNLTNPDVEFLKDIFKMKRCGSGGQVEVDGWIKKLFIEKVRLGYVQNYPSHLAIVPYKNLDTGMKFELMHGVLSSNIIDEFLVPHFGYVINQFDKTTAPVEQQNASL